MVHLFTIWQLWPKGHCKIQQKSVFGTPFSSFEFSSLPIITAEKIKDDDQMYFTLKELQLMIRNSIDSFVGTFAKE